MGMKLLMSTSFHPQTDGAMQRANRSIGQMFRALIKSDQRNWVEKSLLIEFAINASIENAMGLAPFEIDYGYMPAMMKEMRVMEKTPQGVKMFARNALKNMTLVHDALIKDRISQQKYTDKKQHREPEIKINDLIYLSTKNIAMPKGRAIKLVLKYVGPYKIMKAIPLTSNYELELPMELLKRRIHNRFHVSLLRPHNPNDDALFPSRRKVQLYDFGAPDETE